ncbi:hypothetical protein [Leifsonia sp. NPDC058248]|uniref:hypothetical protein n=1 Tax=Leifsonia sp. NPDC058248 TaxID=3346402 RepID=UPI0036DF326F
MSTVDDSGNGRAGNESEEQPQGEHPVPESVATSPQPPQAAPVTVTLTRPSWLNGPSLLGALAHAGISLAGAIVGSAIVLGLFAAGLAMQASPYISGLGSYTGVVGNSVAPDAGSLIGAVFAILSLSLWGDLSANVSVAGGLVSGNASATVVFLPQLVTVILLAAAVLWGFLEEKRRPLPGRLARIVLAAATGLIFAIVVTIFAAIFRITSPSNGASLSITGAGWRLFLGAFVLVSLAALAGRALGAARGSLLTGGRSLRAALPVLVRETLSYASVGLVVFGLLTLVGGLISLSNGIGFGSALLTLPLWFGAVLFSTVSLSHLGGIQVFAAGGGAAFGTSSSSASSSTVSVFTLDGWSWLLVVLALLVAVVAGLRIGASRHPGLARTARGIWKLPVLVGGLWLVLPWIFVYAGASAGGVAGGLGGGGASVFVWLAWWLFLTMTAWTFGVEAIARYLTPIVAGTTPRLFSVVGWRSTNAAWLGGVETVTVPVAAGASSDATTDAPQTAIASAVVAASAAQTLSPRARRRVRIGIISVVSAAVVVGLAAVAISILSATVFSPGVVAQRYLDAVAQGDATTASRMVPPATKDSQKLLTDAVLGKATARIKDIQIGEVRTHASSGPDARSTGTVDVAYTLKGAYVKKSLEVVQTGTEFLFFPKWSVATSIVEPLAFASSQEGSTDVTVGGAQIQVVGNSDITSQFVAYPGEYPVSAADNKYFAVQVPPTVIVGTGDGEPSTVDVSVSATPATIDAVTEAIKKKVDGCSATKDASPADCTFNAWIYSSDNTPVTWKVKSYPTATVAADGSFGTKYESSGEVDASWAGYFGNDTASASIYASGQATVSPSGELTVDVSIDSSPSSYGN